MIDRRTVIRALAMAASVVGVIGQKGNGQDIATVSWAQKRDKEIACPGPPVRNGDALVFSMEPTKKIGSKCYIEEMVPGTASIVLNLNELGSIVVERNGQRVTISRDEIWEALK